MSRRFDFVCIYMDDLFIVVEIESSSCIHHLLAYLFLKVKRKKVKKKKKYKAKAILQCFFFQKKSLVANLCFRELKKSFMLLYNR